MVCKKKLVYRSFFLRTKTFGHNTFCIALHAIKMDNFNILNYKIGNKSNRLSLMDKYYSQFPTKIGIFSTHSKSKKTLPHKSFFLHTKIYGHNTFCIALQMINMDNFMLLIVNLLIKIIYLVKWIRIIAKFLER